MELADEASWDGIEVSGSFAGVVASLVDVNGCRLTGAVFTGAEIDKLRLVDTVVEDCEFSGAVLTRLSAVRVEFRRCRMSGVDVHGGDFRDVKFLDCKLDGANLRSTTWQRSGLEGCLLTEADFSSAKLGEAAIKQCDLRRADFTKAQAAGVTLHGSELEGVVGAEGLRGVLIGSDQVIPLALSVFSALGIRVQDEIG